MSSKTPKANERKIKSERRLLLVGLAGIIIVGAGLLLYTRWSNAQYKVPDVTLQNISYPKFYCLKLAKKQSGCNSDLEVADTATARTNGLSDRPSLAGSKGMIFVFESSSSEQCMWMKAMRFPIDMLWLDENGQIRKIVPNVSPESYPKTYCSTGKYVIELPAGKTENLKLNTGQKLYF